MTMYYTPREEAHLAEKQQEAGALNAIELFICSDGNYRDADAKKRFDDMRRKLIEDYTR
jgi:hypothetical protein